MRRAFAEPGFTRLFAAVSTSGAGDSVMLLVMSMWVKGLTGSNGLAGVTFLFMLLPSLLAPWLGALVDRLPRRQVVVWGNAASALAVLPLLAVRDAGLVWLVWVVSFLYGISFVVVPAATNGLLKQMLPEDVLVDANAAIQTTREGFRLFGPLVGAWLFTRWGGGAVAVVDAVSFLVAAAVVATIRVAEVPFGARSDGPATHLDELLAGVRWLLGDRLLRHTTIGLAIMLFVVGYSESTIYALLDAFGEPATFASVVVMAQGIGAVAGGIGSNLLVRRIGEPAAVALGLAVLGLGAVGAALAPTIQLVLGAAVLIGTTLPVIFVSLTTLQQRRTPHRLMGRVSAALEVVMGVPQAISVAVGAMLVVVLGYRQIWFLMGAVTLVAAAYVVAALPDAVRGGPVPPLEDPAVPVADPGHAPGEGAVL